MSTDCSAENAPVLFAFDMWVVEVEWDRPSPDSPKMPSLVGPFANDEQASAWGHANINDGTWNTAPMAWPVHRLPDVDAAYHSGVRAALRAVESLRTPPAKTPGDVDV